MWEQIARGLGAFTFNRIEAYRVSIPMREPFRISSGEVSQKTVMLLKATEDEAFGWGESSAMPGAFYSSDTPESCEHELLTQVLPAIVGKTFPHLLELEEFLAGASQSPFVRVALQNAAWELLARRRGLSLGQVLGIESRPIPSGLAIGLYDDLDELRRAIERYDSRKYKRLKIKIKHGKDIELVRAIRQWLGDWPLFVDANADYTRADLDLFRELDAFQLMMFEQPFGKNDLETSAELQRAVRTPVCLDESIDSAADAVRAIDSGACRIVNIKLQRVGGYLEALRIIDVCAPRGVPVWMGTMPELGIGSAQALMLAAHPAFTFPTDVEPSARWYEDDIVQPAFELREGCLHSSSGPGVGFGIDPAKLERYTLARWIFQD